MTANPDSLILDAHWIGPVCWGVAAIVSARIFAVGIQYEIGRAKHEGFTDAEIVAALERPITAVHSTDDTHRIESELLGVHTVIDFFDDVDPSG